MAHNNRGGALLLLHRVPEAIAEYQAALRLQPDDASARANLERARMLQRSSESDP
jgi:Flp pilus assembly protein TadD